MIKIYFDMDGVLADFDKKIEEVKGRNKKTGKPNWFKLKAIGPSFWADMEVIPDHRNRCGGCGADSAPDQKTGRKCCMGLHPV